MKMALYKCTYNNNNNKSNLFAKNMVLLDYNPYVRILSK